jgi:hypothetical protein
MLGNLAILHVQRDRGDRADVMVPISLTHRQTRGRRKPNPAFVGRRR